MKYLKLFFRVLYGHMKLKPTDMNIFQQFYWAVKCSIGYIQLCYEIDKAKKRAAK